MSILAVHAGAAYHCEALEAPRYARFFDRLVRPEELDCVALSDFDVVLVPCRTPASRMTPHRERLAAFLDAGGAVVAMGETDQERWLSGKCFTRCPTNWWWWLEPGGSLGLTIAAPDHHLFQHIAPDDVAWHLHGAFDPPRGVCSLVEDSDGRSILYIDEVTTRGRMIVTSLDPFYHHGSHFMPAATRFLDGFLPWLKEEFCR
jgi:hypothetical protein